MEVRSIQNLVAQIDRGDILLPEFQRGYVWNRDQVRGLMQSLYRKHPTGHLLIWRTHRPSPIRGEQAASNGQSLLLLDGQQRLTTLYVLFKGKAPRFYEGESLFFNLYFNMQTEEFMYWQKQRMDKNPAWIEVHAFLSEGLSGMLSRLESVEVERRNLMIQNLSKLSNLDQVRDYSYTVDQVSGEEYSIDEVVDIFNRVNSRGTPLTRADLALAHICSIWHEAREEMRAFSEDMERLGFGVDLNFLVRCLAGVATGSIVLEGTFMRTPAETLKAAWENMQPAFRHLVEILRNDAFIASLNDLPTNNVLIPPTVYLSAQGGTFPTDAIRRRFVRWLHLAGLWARYSGASETKLQQDVAMANGRDLDPTHELEAAILRERGRIFLEASDLDRARIDSSVALLSCVVARYRGARDWFTGVLIYSGITDTSGSQERHYIFTRKELNRVEFDDLRRINAVANRVFLAQKPPQQHRNTPAEEYLAEVAEHQPGALQAQSVPMDRTLWKPENFLEFLAVRRRLLAEAINEFIASWVPEPGTDPIDVHKVRERMAKGEGEHVEFKSSLRWDLREKQINKTLEHAVVKTVAGFLNGRGGTLLIGVDDGGTAIGLAEDYNTFRKNDRDGFELHLHQIMSRDLGEAAGAAFLTVNFHEIDGKDICQITVDPSDHPIYVQFRNEAVFYVRNGNKTESLQVNEAVRYVQSRWSG